MLPEGNKELIGFQVGVRESTRSWHELSVDLKARSLTIAPRLATDDGAWTWRKLKWENPLPKVIQGNKSRTASRLSQRQKRTPPDHQRHPNSNIAHITERCL